MTFTIRPGTGRKEQGSRQPAGIPTAFYRDPITERTRYPKSPTLTIREGNTSTETYHDRTVENVKTAVLTAGVVFAAGLALKILSRRLNW